MTAPKALDRIVDKVLRYRPQKARKRRDRNEKERARGERSK